jgi:hypothetical protein
MSSIAIGFWRDYSRSPILNATLTLPVASGNILLAALTFLVTIAEASLWTIVAFILHSLKAKDGPTTVVNLQHQVNLRNSSGPLGALLDALMIHRAWARKSLPGFIRETFIIVIPAALVFVGFTTAAILSSHVANKAYGSTIARIQQHNCGFWLYNTSTADGFAAGITKTINDTIQARSYVSSFYANSSTSSTARSIFVQSSLPYNVSTSALCPIPATTRCILGSNSAYSMTTPLLNSQKMLGINGKRKDQVSIQLSVTCSPVHIKDISEPVSIGEDTFLKFHLGPTLNSENNYTYIYNIVTPKTGVGYMLGYDLFHFVFCYLFRGRTPSDQTQYEYLTIRLDNKKRH